MSVSDSHSKGTLRRLLTFASRYRRACAGILLLQLGITGMVLAGLDLLGRGIDAIHLAAPDGHGAALTRVIWMACGVLVAGLVATGLRLIVTLTQTRLIQGVIIDLRTSIYDHLQRLHFGFYDKAQSTSLINRVTADVQMVRIFIDGVVIQGMVLGLSLGTYLAYMIWAHPTLTAITLIPVPILFILTFRFSRRIRPAYLRSSERMDHLVGVLSESVQGAHIIKAFGRQSERIAQFDRANHHVARHRAWIFDHVSAYTIAVNTLTYLSTGLLLGFGGWMLIQDRITLGSLVIFFALSERLNTLVNNLATLANNVQQSLAGADRVFEILDNPIAIHDRPDAKPLPDCAGRIEIRGVSFSHNSAHPVLHEINLTIEPGECVALVGATGAGKSTLLSLIPRFYDPQAGQILIDGHDLRDLKIKDLRRQIGVVFQEPFLFSNSIRANIAYGDPEAKDDRIRRAAECACAHTFIESLTDGYDQIVGERGMTLSGGQRQRLALARAMLTDPKILLLDDPVAAVDPETEAQILDAIEHAMHGRTTVMVTSRPSSLRRADRVIVIDNGRIVQSGTHAQLIETHGLYRDMINTQAHLEPSP